MLLRCALNTILKTDVKTDHKDKIKDSYITTFKDPLKSQSTNELVLVEKSKVKVIKQNLNLHFSLFYQHKTWKLTDLFTVSSEGEFQTPFEISIRLIT